MTQGTKPKRAARAIRRAGLLLPNPDRIPADPRWLDRPDPPGVVLEIARLVPQARDAFTPDELDERIERYAAMHAAKLPTPLFGCEQPAVPETEPDVAGKIRCDCCGVIERREGRVSTATAALPDSELHRNVRADRERFRKLGIERWAIRKGKTFGDNEVYCARCFKIWGWPDELAAIAECLDAIADIYARAYGPGGRLHGVRPGGKPAQAVARGGAAGGGEVVGVQRAPLPDLAGNCGIG